MNKNTINENVELNVDTESYIVYHRYVKEFIRSMYPNESEDKLRKRTNCLADIFIEIDNTSIFESKSERIAKKLLKLEEKADRLQNDLLIVMKELGLSVRQYELYNLLQATKLRAKRVTHVDNDKAEQYKKKMLEAGFLSTEIRQDYMPKIKKYFKSKKDNLGDIAPNLKPL